MLPFTTFIHCRLAQWGRNSSNEDMTKVNYPINFTEFETPILVANDDGTFLYRLSVGGHDLIGFYQKFVSDNYSNTLNRLWIAIGR